MRLIDAFQKLNQLRESAIATRDAAGILSLDVGHASTILRRLTNAGLLVSIRKGFWAFPERMDPLLLPRYLASPFPTYISLQSALYIHDMILQIPAVVYAVTLARTKKFSTPFCDVSLHHVDTAFFFGYEVDPKTNIALALPEKALLDFFYLSSAKTQLFKALPEIEITKGFSLHKARKMIERIPSLQRRTIVKRHFEQWASTFFKERGR